MEARLKEFKDYMSKIEYLGNATGLLYWDMRVGIPKKGIPYRAEMIGYLSGEQYKLETSSEMKEFIDFFTAREDLDVVTKAMVDKARRNYERSKCIPENRFKAYVIATSHAEAAWEEAKEKSDYSIFLPHLEELVNFNKEFLEYWGYEKNKYDTLLDFYEPGITVEKLDAVFGELREELVKLLEGIKKSEVKIDSSFFNKRFTVEEQEEFSKFILEKMEFDFEAGRLDVSVHPFTINFGNKDVRITTHYYENDFKSALFSSIHEGGHALYEQDIADELEGTGLGTGTSMGIHESQSRFYENILGRSKEFWRYFFPEAIKRFPQFEKVSFEEFYRAINEVCPSLIRTEADELTYGLHVIVRYEIEKALINGEIEVKDLPEIWNKKYVEYLGVEPKNDSEGVLQDMHWSGGSFGYFPSYALGNLYGAQFLNTMHRDIPDLYKQIEEGNLSNIHQWLKEKIHLHGSVYTPAELIVKVTGEELNPKYFVDYLKNKYSEIYKL